MLRLEERKLAETIFDVLKWLEMLFAEAVERLLFRPAQEGLVHIYIETQRR